MYLYIYLKQLVILPTFKNGMNYNKYMHGKESLEKACLYPKKKV